MIIKKNGYRNDENSVWDVKLHQPYDFEHKGLLKYLMSNKLTSTDNSILKFLLYYYEQSLIYCMKYIDILNNYKNYLKNNR